MNKARRTRIKEASQMISTVLDLLEHILADEEEAFESMPEGLQASENGIVSEEAQGLLNDAIEALEEASCCLEEI